MLAAHSTLMRSADYTVSLKVQHFSQLSLMLKKIKHNRLKISIYWSKKRFRSRFPVESSNKINILFIICQNQYTLEQREFCFQEFLLRFNKIFKLGNFWGQNWKVFMAKKFAEEVSIHIFTGFLKNSWNSRCFKDFFV